MKDYPCNLYNQRHAACPFGFPNDNNKSNCANQSVDHISFHSKIHARNQNCQDCRQCVHTDRTKSFSIDRIDYCDHCPHTLREMKKKNE